MTILKRYLPILAVIAGSVLVIFRFFGDIVNNPSAFVFGAGDGIKNYYTVLYQVVHGEELYFDGMLYPHGDLLTYADGQPVLTTVFRMFFEPTVENGLKMMGTMNLIMIFSLLICAVLVHAILRKALVPPWFSVPFALIIAFLSPQVQRFTGHYAIAYTFYIPLLWWLIIKLSENGIRWGWALLYTLVVLVFSLNQPYHLLFSLALAGSILCYQVFRSVVFMGDKRLWPWLAGITFLPAILLSFYFSQTELYTDRPLTPYGLGAYESSFSSVFVPVHGPMFTLIRDYLFRLWTFPEWEGQGYVGIPGTLFLFLFLCKVVVDLRKKGWKAPFWLSSPKVIQQAFIPSVIVLIVSAGVLNRFGFIWLSDHIVSLKQFRSLGRLVWIFYYIFTVSAVVYFFMIYRRIRIASNNRLKSVALTLMVILLGVWGVDMVSNIKGNKSLMLIQKPGANTFSNGFTSGLMRAGCKASDYQAILPIPFNLVGSEKISLLKGDVTFTNAVNASFSTGLPMFGGLMSRTSMAVTQKQAQLVADPLIEREIIKDLPNGKPFLVIHSEGGLSKGEKFLLDQAEFIAQEPGFRVLSLMPEKLNAALKTYGSTTDRTSINWFEFPNSAKVNTQELHFEPEQTVLDTSLTRVGNSTQVELSYWLLINRESTGLPEVNLIINQPDRSDTTLIRPTDFADLMNGWVRIHRFLELPPGTSTIKLVNTTRPGTFWNPTVRRVTNQESDTVIPQ